MLFILYSTRLGFAYDNCFSVLLEVSGNYFVEIKKSMLSLLSWYIQSHKTFEIVHIKSYDFTCSNIEHRKDFLTKSHATDFSSERKSRAALVKIFLLGSTIFCLP